MFDYNLGYRTLCGYTTQRQMEFIHDNIQHYPLYEKLLGFQRQMHNTITAVYNEYSSQIKSKNSNNEDQIVTEMGISVLCGFNIRYLFEALHPLEHGDIHVTASIIRPVYESIPKIFYVFRHPEDIHSIMCKEDFEIWLTHRKYDDFLHDRKRLNTKQYLEEFLKTDGKRYFKNKNYKMDKSFFNDFTHKFNNAWYRKQIYTNESLQMQDNFYSSLSSSSHANIIRYEMNEETNSLIYENFMKILVDLTYHNLFVYVNSCSRALREINELEDTLAFVLQTHQELKNYLRMTYLYPDVPEYMKGFEIYPSSRSP